MEQKNTKAVPFLSLTCLVMMLVGFSFTTRENNRADSQRDNVFPAYSNNVILVWNATVLNALEAPNYQHVLSASRLLAMVHIAQYDALNTSFQEQSHVLNNMRGRIVELETVHDE